MLRFGSNTSPTMGSVRWAFNFMTWKPTKTEWMLAAQCIQPEEKTRIGKFYYKKDAKSSMIGRCMLRKVITETLEVPWDSFTLTRTEKEKPVLKDLSLSKSLCFNVAHQGDYTVLAAEMDMQCGVDVMKVERPRAQSVPEYFRLMKRQFTTQEWQTIKTPDSEYEQLQLFYRFWCLKESYIKAIGIGLGFDLTRIDFHIKTLSLDVGETVSDTVLYLDGTLTSPPWVFQETRLDKNHFVAVGLKKTSQETSIHQALETPIKFLTFEELMQSAKPLMAEDLEYWLEFDKKEEMPNLQRKDDL